MLRIYFWFIREFVFTFSRYFCLCVPPRILLGLVCYSFQRSKFMMTKFRLFFEWIVEYYYCCMSSRILPLVFVSYMCNTSFEKFSSVSSSCPRNQSRFIMYDRFVQFKVQSDVQFCLSIYFFSIVKQGSLVCTQCIQNARKIM